MQPVKELKQLLLEELEHIVRTSVNLIRKIKPEDLDFRPRENMRSLKELVLHLVSVPAVDLLILQEKREPDIRNLENEIAAGTDQEKWVRWMTSGLNDVKKYMEELPDEPFLHKMTKPFYLDHGSVQAKSCRRFGFFNSFAIIRRLESESVCLEVIDVSALPASALHPSTRRECHVHQYLYEA